MALRVHYIFISLVLFGSEVVFAGSLQFTTLDFPGSGLTQAFGINSSGEVVGAQSSGGFVYSAGNFSHFDVPGSTDTGAIGVNDAGQIVGASSGPIAFLYDGIFSTIGPPTALAARGRSESFHAAR